MSLTTTSPGFITASSVASPFTARDATIPPAETVTSTSSVLIGPESDSYTEKDVGADEGSVSVSFHDLFVDETRAKKLSPK